jgi:hypothetical protein
MRRGVLAAQLHERLPVAPDNCHRHAVALALAGLGGGRRNRQRGSLRQILVRRQLRPGRRRR